MGLLKASNRKEPETRGPGLIVSSLCALHGIWAFMSRASEPVLAPRSKYKSMQEAQVGGGRQVSPVTLDGAPGSCPIPLAKTSRKEEGWHGAQGSEAGLGLASEGWGGCDLCFL